MERDRPVRAVDRDAVGVELRIALHRLLAGARVVKAANTLGAEVLGSDPHEAGGQRVIFVSGDAADAKADVVALFQDAGFAAIDLGDLATGGAMQQIHHPLAGVNLIRL
jgi:predicted dinucleotide-binding enzyme